PLEQYPQSFQRIRCPDNPTLSNPRKHGGQVNFNHCAYLSISRQFLVDSLSVIRKDPIDYLRRMLHGWSLFLIPPYEYAFVYENRRRLDPIVRVYNAVFYGIRAGTGKPPV